MKKIFTATFLMFSLISFSLMFCSFSYGQTDASKASRNNAYLEVLGNGGLYSLNYERIVVEHFALRVGFASWKSQDFLAQAIIIHLLSLFLF